MSGKVSLEKEIEKERMKERYFGWFNSCLQYFVASLSLAGSVGASILAATDYPNNWLTALIAVIPAMVLAATKIFPFERRALAHWKKEYRLHGLQLKLKHEEIEEKEASAEFREIEATTFDEWPLLSPVVGERREQLTKRPTKRGK